MNWSNVLRAKEKKIMKNDELENKKWSNHQHQVGDYVKALHRKNSDMCPTKLSQPNEGLHQIVEVLENTVKSSVELFDNELALLKSLLTSTGNKND